MFSSWLFQDKDFDEIEEASKIMEAKYSQYFDCVIVNNDLQDSCMDLFTAIQHAQEEPQWIPASWLTPDQPWHTNTHRANCKNTIILGVKGNC